MVFCKLNNTLLLEEWERTALVIFPQYPTNVIYTLLSVAKQLQQVDKQVDKVHVQC
jgi:hypothetical protein